MQPVGGNDIDNVNCFCKIYSGTKNSTVSIFTQLNIQLWLVIWLWHLCCKKKKLLINIPLLKKHTQHTVKHNKTHKHAVTDSQHMILSHLHWPPPIAFSPPCFSISFVSFFHSSFFLPFFSQNPQHFFFFFFFAFTVFFPMKKSKNSKNPQQKQIYHSSVSLYSLPFFTKPHFSSPHSSFKLELSSPDFISFPSIIFH